jgi:hypothetical protein
LTTVFKINGLHFNLPDRKRPPTIRLTPPAGSSAPTMYWDLGIALGPGSTYDVKLKLGDYYDNVMQTTQVIVLDSKGKTPQRGARVTVQSVEIDNLECPGVIFKTLTADEFGRVTVDLPPGQYTVRATPRDPSGPFSIGEAPLSVVKLPQNKVSGGHAVQLPKRATLLGSVNTEAGEPLADIPVNAVPSQSGQSYDLAGLITNDSWAARQSATTTDKSGDFSMKVDVGSPLDVSIRPADGSGYPWLVQPQFLLQKGGEVDETLKGASLPWPAVIKGQLSDPGGAPVAGAKVDAYLPIDVDGATVVVQIGETTTDADGNYELVLPASITSGK